MKKLFFLLLIVAFIAGCSAKYQAAYPLHGAIYNADISKTKELLQLRMVNDVRDDAGMLPIQVAVVAVAGYGLPNNDIIKLLIENGADPNAKSTEGETAMDIALSYARGDIVDDLIRAGVKLWTPETGKARLFFVGTGLWDYLTVSVGKQSKKLNQGMLMGLAFIDVDQGKHTISVSEKEASSIDAIAGQTYYLEITQDMKRRALHYAMIKAASVMITPITEGEAKEEIKKMFKAKEIK